MKLSRAILGLAALAAVSCSPKSPAPAGGATDTAGANAAPVPLEVPYNIGDVETSTKILAQVSPRSQTGNVSYHELKTKKSDLAMAEAAVSQPYPAELWVVSHASTPKGFRGADAVLVRQRIYIDSRQEPIAEQSFVWSGQDAVMAPKDLEVNIMPLLDPAAESVLVHARAQVLWFPNTDPATIDPASPPKSSERPLEKLSNSLRITFN